MGVPYLHGRRWSELTREERFYCFTLYFHAVADPAGFAGFVAEKAGLPFDIDGEWDVGVEVCFYRDYLWHRHLHVRGSDFSPKRTFDLCLFGPRDIIVVEAKVCQAFIAKESSMYEDDARKVPAILEQPELRVWLVALASRRYFEQERQHGDGNALRPFDGHTISWADADAHYHDPLLAQADALYGSGVPRHLERNDK